MAKVDTIKKNSAKKEKNMATKIQDKCVCVCANKSSLETRAN